MSLKKTLSRLLLSSALGLCFATSNVAPAQAFPGFFTGKKDAKRINKSTQVVVMKKGQDTVVTIMADYEGPLDELAMVIPVPADVEIENVHAIKTDMVEHLDHISSPRFHEYWEKDPCDPEKQIQEWERDLRVSGTGFLGEGMPMPEGQRKVAKEMKLKVDAVFKQGSHNEHTFHLVEPGASLSGALGELGYKMPDGADVATKSYVDRGMKFLIVEVDTKRVGLTGGDRAVLSPVQFATREKVDVNSTLGLLNSNGMQELLIFVIHPDKRFEAGNYKNVFPPTNIHVDFKVKERMGEFYAAIHDMMLAKDPQAMLVEYAWDAEGCGRPCPNEGLSLSELLSFGGNFFELSVPEEERNPEPPEMTEEEEEKMKIFLESKEDPKERKEEEKRMQEDRVELARRKALIERHKYMVTRIHHRYDKAGLPKDIELKTAQHITGGVGVPKGEKGELDTEVKVGGNESEYQVRYSHLHPNIKVINCDQPQRYRWGIPPRSYRGLRKVWTASDLARINRKKINPAEMVLNDVPALGLTGQWTKEAEAKAAEEAAAKAAAEKGKCGCRVLGSSTENDAASWLLALSMAGLWVGRRRARR